MCVFNIFFVPLHLGNNKFEIYLFNYNGTVTRKV